MTRLAFVISIGSIASFAPAAESRRSPHDLTGPWQLFIDDYLIAAKKNVLRRYHSFNRYKRNPLVVVDKPWEHDLVMCLSVLPNEASATWIGSRSTRTSPGR